MRVAIIVVCVIVAVVYLGGAVNIGGAPAFQRIDSVLNADVFMKAYRSVFFFLYSSDGALRSGIERTDSGIREFQERPIGIDKQEKYDQLEDASK